MSECVGRSPGALRAVWGSSLDERAAELDLEDRLRAERRAERRRAQLALLHHPHTEPEHEHGEQSTGGSGGL